MQSQPQSRSRSQPQPQPQETVFPTVVPVPVPSSSFLPSSVSWLGYGSNQSAIAAMNNAFYSQFRSQQWRSLLPNYSVEAEMNEHRVQQMLKEIEDYRREVINMFLSSLFLSFSHLVIFFL